MSNILSLFKRTSDPKHTSMATMLETMANKSESGFYGKNPAAVVLILNRDNGDSYDTLYESCGMTTSQVVALMEVVKYRILHQRMKEL